MAPLPAPVPGGRGGALGAPGGSGCPPGLWVPTVAMARAAAHQAGGGLSTGLSVMPAVRVPPRGGG